MAMTSGAKGARGLVCRSRALLVASALLALLVMLLLAGREPSTARPAALPPPSRAPARLLPHDYWRHRRDHPDRYQQLSCSELPTPERLQWAAASWQRLAVPAGSLYAYAAHWDPRQEPLVRVLVYCDVAPLPNLTCLLWFENRNAPDAVPARPIYGWRPEWGGPFDTVNEPYILGCPLMPGSAVPRAVSVATTRCESPRNVLAVQGAPRDLAPWRAPPPLSVAVSIKWLDYPEDTSGDLVEWIELLLLFGAQKLYIYVLQAHPNMRRVLRHYEALGFADVTELDHAPREREMGSESSRTFRAMRRELLPFNDALYRAMPHYTWLAVFDMDEIIVPMKVDSWADLLEGELRRLHNNDGVDALVLINYYFLRNAQRSHAAAPPARMLAYFWRARNASRPGEHVKSFHNTSSVTAMHNHTPMSCLRGEYSCYSPVIPLENARLHHYRARCDYDRADCEEMHDVVRDAALQRFSRVLAPASAVLRDLHIPLPTPSPLAVMPSITEPPTTTPEPITEPPTTKLLAPESITENTVTSRVS